MLVFSNVGRKAICSFFRDQKTQVLSKESLYMWVVMYRMYWFVSGLSAMRLVVAVDVISLRVGRWRLPKKNFFRYLERGFCSLGGMLGHCAKDTRGALYSMWKPSPRHSPGTCRPPELSSALQTIAVDLLRHMHMALRSEALLFLQQSLLLLASDSNKTHPLTLVSFSTLLHQ